MQGTACSPGWDMYNEHRSVMVTGTHLCSAKSQAADGALMSTSLSRGQNMDSRRVLAEVSQPA